MQLNDIECWIYIIASGFLSNLLLQYISIFSRIKPFEHDYITTTMSKMSIYENRWNSFMVQVLEMQQSIIKGTRQNLFRKWNTITTTRGQEKKKTNQTIIKKKKNRSLIEMTKIVFLSCTTSKHDSQPMQWHDNDIHNLQYLCTLQLRFFLLLFMLPFF